MKAKKIAYLITSVLAALTITISAATPAIAASAAVRGTPVTRIRALVNLHVRTGPSTHYRVVGKLWRGDHAAVTGASDSYGWWRIRCPWGGTCWVSANPNYAKPIAWRK